MGRTEEKILSDLNRAGLPITITSHELVYQEAFDRLLEEGKVTADRRELVGGIVEYRNVQLAE